MEPERRFMSSRCPSVPWLLLEVRNLLDQGHDWLRTSGELAWRDHGLYVVFRADSASPGGGAVRCAVWCPRLGWRECRNGDPSLGPAWPSAWPVGPQLAALALGEARLAGAGPQAFVDWLEGMFSDPASLHLALSVMAS